MSRCYQHDQETQEQAEARAEETQGDALHQGHSRQLVANTDRRMGRVCARNIPMSWKSICELKAADNGDVVWSPKRTDLGFSPVVVGSFPKYAAPMIEDVYRIGLCCLLDDMHAKVMDLNTQLRQVRRQKKEGRRLVSQKASS
jgi:hypothetical protein